MSVDFKFVSFTNRYIRSILDPEIDKRLRKAAEEYKNFVKSSMGSGELPDIESGDLKASIKVAKSSKHVYSIGSDLVYSKFLEFGTSRMQKKPFLRPTLISFMSKLKGVFR